jgi:hypothetical protein
MSDRWKTRFPVSRRCPRSAATGASGSVARESRCRCRRPRVDRAAGPAGGRGVGHPAGRVLQPQQVARGQRRPGAGRTQVHPAARDDAPDEGDEEQEVDRGEPGGVEDVEQAEFLQQRRRGGVGLDVVQDRRRVLRALRVERAGNRRERQQEQQHQRGAHRGELPPDPPGELQRGQRRGPVRQLPRGRDVLTERRVGAGRAGVEPGVADHVRSPPSWWSPSSRGPPTRRRSRRR